MRFLVALEKPIKAACFRALAEAGSRIRGLGETTKQIPLFLVPHRDNFDKLSYDLQCTPKGFRAAARGGADE